MEGARCLLGPDAKSPMKLHHIGIATRSMSHAKGFFGDVLGLPLLGEDVVEQDGVRVASFSLGESSVELLEPLNPGSPVGRFLDRKGEGIHHICFEVADLDKTLELLKKKGVPFVDETPRIGAHGHRVAFLHPKGTGGVLIELSEPADRPKS